MNPFLLLLSLFSKLLVSHLPGGPPDLGLQALSRAGERLPIPNILLFSIILLTAGLGTAVIGQYTEMFRILCKVHKILSY